MKPCADAPRSSDKRGESRETQEKEKGFEKVRDDLRKV